MSPKNVLGVAAPLFQVPFLRSAHNYDRNKVSFETGVLSLKKSMALQSGRDDSDINVIVKRFGVTGVLPQSQVLPTYGDFSGVVDFRSAQDAVLAARARFLQVPADVRKRFGNDPQEFVRFCSDPKNLEELRRMGLAKAAIVVDSVVSPVVKPVGEVPPVAEVKK